MRGPDNRDKGCFESELGEYLLENEVLIKCIFQLPFPFWCADKVLLNDVKYEFEFPATAEPCNFWNSSGLRYEANEVRKCLNASRVESDVMSHKDSELLAKISDEIRRQIGVRYDVD